ncbi:hypothetical protein [Paracoccus saliphilus]|uniref:Uncharacterized protein n=1 Tax=Paracoccus saliphilus TaxID=405559 RepID=A0AA46A7P1_9RHOB|nr:hypothetical protein [Paracoccus saliphilus]WCR02934.1 hypothetical protein JHX88_19350 [Paracoccus saliphilus]SIT15840.1 hypothetical protein SAMN05421772_1279 [Paracoccus saliphilus]
MTDALRKLAEHRAELAKQGMERLEEECLRRRCYERFIRPPSILKDKLADDQ